jgi:hypothetical protein
MIEHWKDVPGYEGSYQISDLGRVRSVPRHVYCRNGHLHWIRGRILKPSVGTCGHIQVRLSRAGRSPTVPVHQLVLKAFIGPRPKGKEGCHNDGVHANNRLSNLRWDTHRSNMTDASNQGLLRVLPVRRSDGKTYKSCSAAATSIDVHRSSVSRSIRLKQRCGGYTWEFVTQAVASEI